MKYEYGSLWKSQSYLDRLRTKTRSSPGHELNPKHFECEAAVVTTQ